MEEILNNTVHDLLESEQMEAPDTRSTQQLGYSKVSYLRSDAMDSFVGRIGNSCPFVHASYKQPCLRTMPGTAVEGRRTQGELEYGWKKSLTRTMKALDLTSYFDMSTLARRVIEFAQKIGKGSQERGINLVYCLP
jgi:hypothetical protein